jgi:hypothetical protein
MAVLVSSTSGNWTNPDIWEQISTTASNLVFTSVTSLTTTFQSSTSFIPGAITTNGLWLGLYSRASSPTGTFSIELFNSTTSTVAASYTDNVSVLPTNANLGGAKGIYFRWSSPVTLTDAQSYVIRARTGSSTQITLWYGTSITNWSRILTITATASPSATDQLYISSRYSSGTLLSCTVSMNNTNSTEYGAVFVGHSSTLDWPTNQTTQLRLSGDTWTSSGWSVYLGGGNFFMGTSASRIQDGFTASLFITPGSANGRRITLLDGSSFRAAGSTMSYTWTTLAANVATSSTTCTTAVSTGWKVGEEIVIAPTRRAATTATTVQYDRRVLTSVSGTTLGFSALTYYHDGVGELAGEIINITRNCRIVCTTPSTFRTGIAHSIVNGTTIELDDVQIYGMGTSTGTGAISVFGSGATAFILIRNCAFVDGSTGISIVSTTNFYNLFVNNNVFTTAITTGSFLILQGSQTLTSPIVTGSQISNNCMIFGGTSSAVIGIDLYTTTIPLINNHVSGVQTVQGIRVGLVNIYQVSGLVSGNVVRASGYGMLLVLNDGLKMGYTQSGNATIRNLNYGLYIVGSSNTRYDNLVSIGNQTANFLLGYNVGITQQFNLVFNNATIRSDSVNTTQYGIILGLGGVPVPPIALTLTMNDCSFGTPSVHTLGDIRFNAEVNQVVDLVCNNCDFASSIEVSQPGFMSDGSRVAIQRANKVNGAHRTYYSFGLLTLDTTIFRSGTKSTRMTPTSATFSQDFGKKLIPVKANSTPTISVWVRKSVVGDGSAYNGSQPRLWLTYNPAIALFPSYDDIILATASAANGTWEQLSATLPVVPYEDTAFEVYLDCRGTIGWVNVDDWRVSQ